MKSMIFIIRLICYTLLVLHSYHSLSRIFENDRFTLWFFLFSQIIYLAVNLFLEKLLPKSSKDHTIGKRIVISLVFMVINLVPSFAELDKYHHWNFKPFENIPADIWLKIAATIVAALVLEHIALILERRRAHN